jgi:hypothetical protein
MASHWFNPAVYVKTDRPGLRFGVSHVEAASEQLLKWTKKGPKWAYAVCVCRAALAEEVPLSRPVRHSRRLPRRRRCSFLLSRGLLAASRYCMFIASPPHKERRLAVF